MIAIPRRTIRALIVVLAAGCAGASGAQGTRGPLTPLGVAPDLLRTAPEGPRAGAVGLDVESLKARLRDTDAIGVFTKLALSNQMDDLLQLFRAYHAGRRDTDIALLRQPYDMLVLKVLALVQDGDPSLARTISGSREAIWNILADPLKFSALV
jgi:hypothetical protein